MSHSVLIPVIFIIMVGAESKFLGILSIRAAAENILHVHLDDLSSRGFVFLNFHILKCLLSD